MLKGIGAGLFANHSSNWFVESLFTQTLIIHVIRTHKIPFIQSRASWPLIASSLIIITAGALLTVSPLAGTLGFVAPPGFFWLLLAERLVCYVILTQLMKTWSYQKFGESGLVRRWISPPRDGKPSRKNKSSSNHKDSNHSGLFQTAP